MKNTTKKPTTRRRRKENVKNFPKGWDEKRVQKVLAHYENQSDNEAAAEDEAAYKSEGQTVMIVPTELVPAIRRLIGPRRGAS